MKRVSVCRLVLTTCYGIFQEIISHGSACVYIANVILFLKPWPNGKRLATKQHIKHCLVTKHFVVWPPCLVLFDRVWWCLINFKAMKHSIKQLKTFLSRVWWAMFCSLGQPLIKHVWCGHAYHACSSACINCLICDWSNIFLMFGRPTFPVRTGLNSLFLFL